jgi:dCMP deaminase
MPKIIALVGLTGSGKSEAGAILEGEGFHKIRFGQITMDIMKEQGIVVNEENERKIREGLREDHGMAAYATLNLPKIKAALEQDQHVVLDGLYSWDEYKVLKDEFPEMEVVCIHAAPNVRYARLAQRPERPLTMEEAKSRDYAEIEISQKSGPISMADHTIINNESLEDLRRAVKQVIGVHERHDWDEYFMSIARQVANRGTCDRGRSGAVVMKNKRILTTGYVGSPAGLPHCDDVGHLMHEVVQENGKTSKHCVRTAHAEQNALIQAARSGISLEGATLYCKMEPCSRCAMMIINAGIIRVVAEKAYHGAHYTREMFNQAKVQLDILHDEIEKYDQQ